MTPWYAWRNLLHIKTTIPRPRPALFQLLQSRLQRRQNTHHLGEFLVLLDQLRISGIHFVILVSQLCLQLLWGKTRSKIGGKIAIVPLSLFG